MNAPGSREDEDLKIFRSWLVSAEKSPAAWAALADKLECQRRRWLPPLVVIATHDPPSVLTLAAKLLDEIATKTRDVGDLSGLLSALPRKSSALADTAMKLTARLLDLFPEHLRETDVEAAKLWNNLSERCQDANWPEDALRCARRAVEVSGAVPSESPGAKQGIAH